MDKRGTGAQPWKLKSGSNDNPTLTAGKTTSWQLNDVPDRCPTGPLAYYLPCLLLTIKGSVTQPAEGAAIPRDLLPSLLIDSIDWTNAWHGNPVSGDHVKGAYLPLVEFIGGGFQYGQRQSNDIPDTAGAHNFSITVAIPACDRRHRLFRRTSQLALLYQPSQLKLNMAALSVLQTWVPGATWGTLSATLTAPLFPRQQIMLGTGVEWILHEVAAAQNGQAVKINGFGRDTLFTGVENKGGVMTLGELTDVLIQGGVFLGNNVEQISFPWRGLQQLDDIDAYLAQFEGLLPNDRPQTTPNGVQAATGTTVNDWNTFPRTQERLDAESLTPFADSLRIFPLVMGGDELELTELQTADRDETYFLKVNGGFDPGDHLILAQYARVWQATKRADFEALVKGGSNSLASYVYGASAASRTLKQIAPTDDYAVTGDQLTYLPWALV